MHTGIQANLLPCILSIFSPDYWEDGVGGFLIGRPTSAPRFVE